jgi:[ribosomal protein S5]-alanine N-acetyltransferase
MLHDLVPLADAAQAEDDSRIEALIHNSRQWWRAHGYGIWVILRKGEDGIIGWCGLRPVHSANEPELLYGLAARARGRGFAAEAARAVVEFALLVPVIKGVWAATTPDHISSVRVMERIGMTFDCRAALEGVDSVIYRIRRAD